jgi:hypothetical protein
MSLLPSRARGTHCAILSYFVGIGEVYSVTLERYGRAETVDVLSVLHELPGAAGGFGDGRDIWKPRRYSWRYRNVGTGRMTLASLLMYTGGY